MAEYQITLTVSVHDTDALKKAAKSKALESMTEAEWTELRETNWCQISADLHMLLDPGASPAGIQIEDSSVECTIPDEDEEEKITEEVPNE